MYIIKNLTVPFQNNSNIQFVNTANRYGGAIYYDLLQGRSKLKFYTKEISFASNTALIGADVYIDIPTSCDETCLNNSIIGINKRTLLNNKLANHITTPSGKLEFYDIECVDNQTNMSWNIYMMKNVILGQVMTTEARIRDYYDGPADTTQFTVSGDNGYYKINRSHVLVSCTVFQ